MAVSLCLCRCIVYVYSARETIAESTMRTSTGTRSSVRSGRSQGSVLRTPASCSPAAGRHVPGTRDPPTASTCTYLIIVYCRAGREGCWAACTRYEGPTDCVNTQVTIIHCRAGRGGCWATCTGYEEWYERMW